MTKKTTPAWGMLVDIILALTSAVSGEGCVHALSMMSVLVAGYNEGGETAVEWRLNECMGGRRKKLSRAGGEGATIYGIDICTCTVYPYIITAQKGRSTRVQLSNAACRMA